MTSLFAKLFDQNKFPPPFIKNWAFIRTVYYIFFQLFSIAYHYFPQFSPLHPIFGIFGTNCNEKAQCSVNTADEVGRPN